MSTCSHDQETDHDYMISFKTSGFIMQTYLKMNVMQLNPNDLDLVLVSEQYRQL